MSLTREEREELEDLRKQIKRYEQAPLEHAFDQLERILNKPYSNGFDAIMPVNAYRILANALIELKKELLP